jgi:WD40 repeat protein
VQDTLRAHSGSVQSLVFTPGGKTLISGGSDALIRRWDVATGRQLAQLADPKVREPVQCLAISHDGSSLADPRVGLWDLESGRPRALRSERALSIPTVAFSPVEPILATGHEGGGTLWLWDATSRERLRPLNARHNTYSLSFSRDGRILASGGGELKVKLWDVATGREFPGTLLGHRAQIISLAFSPDGHVLASGSLDGTVIIWDVADPARPSLRIRLEGNAGAIWAVAYSPDGATIAASSEDGTVKLWDPTTGRERCTLLGHTGKVRSLAFSPDGSVLATGDAGGTIRLWRR